MEPRPLKKVLCANRGEIAIRVFRACTELGLRTVAIYSNEDRVHEHRHKADEAYLVGVGKKPVEAYLGIEEILDVAERAGVDAIHPGYGFLSENADFADACAARGIRFIGPSPKVVRLMGDKVAAKRIATEAGVPCVPGISLSEGEQDAASSPEDELRRANELFEAEGPLIVKAAHGGGGRGMRAVYRIEELPEALERARSESRAAFGSSEVFLEKLLTHVRHIEVQILGDLHGELIHLHERDCSVQRRHQKVIEIAPAPNLDPALKQRICDDAVKLARTAGYTNAGTVEFLVDGDRHYFIECNARLQVEHTVTEQITGVDLVQSQLRIAEGHRLSDGAIGISGQDAIQPRGYAVQCRVTTEDPENDFMPDSGTLLAWRTGAGFGIRLDAGNGYSGAYISPHYDSLLVKVTSYGFSFGQAVRKGIRALQEFRIRGVKTNLPFLENVLRHPTFQAGETYTRFIDETPELFEMPRRRDRATKLLRYLGELIVNGHPTIKKEQRRNPTSLPQPRLPTTPSGPIPDGTTRILAERGPAGLAEWVRAQSAPLLTDTTMRDAHQSLLATRMRSHDILKVAPATAHLQSELFSLEVWGGATFDTAYRFLMEDPWDRLRRLKEAIPNVLLQMLLRGANAVGYTSYPENVVEAFIDEAAEAGVDVFRVFDSLNDLDSMKISVDRVIKTGKVAEVAMCYTGDVANPERTKYSLDYYADLARRIEDMGAHFLCIKDMAGLLRPPAAAMLIDRLRESVSLPIHLHTHDTSGNGIATYLEAIGKGVDIVDVAVSSMAGLTSQPSMSSLIAALHGTPRDTGLSNRALQPLADYWEDVREHYAPFEAALKSSTSEVYYHEIPGGQYSNLRPQVAELGLLSRWNDVKHAFAVVNQLVGDIPKVTPSSKMVGDFAIFLLKNDLFVKEDTFEASVEATRARVIEQAPGLDFPTSVVGYFQGELGEPPGGFPEPMRKAVLKGMAPKVNRADALPPADFDAIADDLEARYDRVFQRHEAVSWALYPRVVDAYLAAREKYEDASILDTPTYFYGLEPGQEVWADLEPGKTLVLSLSAVGEPDENGERTVWFELNGHARTVTVADKALTSATQERRQATPGQPKEIGSTMPGTVLAVHVKEGAEVATGDPLVTLEAMKMETVVRAPTDGKIKEVLVKAQATVQPRELLVVLE